MKRCPECRRDYFDDTLLYCLEDGNALVQGSVPSPDEPATAILSGLGVPPLGGSGSEPGAVATGFPDAEAQTRAQINTTDQTAILRTGAEAEPRGSLGGFRKSIGSGTKKRASVAEAGNLSANRAAKPLAALVVAVLVLVGGFFGYRYFSASGSTQINSIAVMPFENNSGNADSDYLSDGLAESLIYRLSQLPDLKVSPTSSVFRYKGKATDPKIIAQELGVDSVLAGRIVQRGDSLSISVELIDVRNNKLVWGEKYERKLSELLATQRQIATEISQNLKLKLTGNEQGLTKPYTNSNEAYQLFLKGRYHFAKRTKDDMLKSIEYFQQAINLDPNFALAYARIADVYNQMPAYPFLSSHEAFPKAKAAAKKALEIDPSLSEAHTALANVLAVYDWNWAEAEREFKRAIELNPNSADAHFRYAQVFLSPTGRHDEAIREMNRAVELEPLDLPMSALFSQMLRFSRQNDRAIEQAKKTLDLEPEFVLGIYVLGQALIIEGKYQEAIDIGEKALLKDPNRQFILENAAYAYAKSGRRKEAEEIIAKFRELAKTNFISTYYTAIIYSALGDKDKAFAELQTAAENKDWSMQQMKIDPLMDPLRDDPRFEDLVKRLELPE